MIDAAKLAYFPDFLSECRECGSSPTVVVLDHVVPGTDLCGPCFFGDRRMLDWETWNDERDATE